MIFPTEPPHPFILAKESASSIKRKRTGKWLIPMGVCAIQSPSNSLAYSSSLRLPPPPLSSFSVPSKRFTPPPSNKRLACPLHTLLPPHPHPYVQGCDCFDVYDPNGNSSYPCSQFFVVTCYLPIILVPLSVSFFSVFNVLFVSACGTRDTLNSPPPTLCVFTWHLAGRISFGSVAAVLLSVHRAFEEGGVVSHHPTIYTYTLIAVVACACWFSGQFDFARFLPLARARALSFSPPSPAVLLSLCFVRVCSVVLLGPLLRVDLLPA